MMPQQGLMDMIRGLMLNPASMPRGNQQAQPVSNRDMVGLVDPAIMKQYAQQYGSSQPNQADVGLVNRGVIQQKGQQAQLVSNRDMIGIADPAVMKQYALQYGSQQPSSDPFKQYSGFREMMRAFTEYR